MSFEFWIVLVLVASAASAGIGWLVARRSGPTRAELDAMAAELDEARQQAETVQANVNEHFEQSAVLFGKLARDYREFLEHFSTSAQTLGLSESRARELIEQGSQPLLSQWEEGSVVGEAEMEPEADDAVEAATQQEAVEPAAGAETVAVGATAEPDTAAEPGEEIVAREPVLASEPRVDAQEAATAEQGQAVEEEPEPPLVSDVVFELPERDAAGEARRAKG